MMALTSSFELLRVKPGARRHRLMTLNRVAGPLIVFSIPSSTSTTP